MESGDVFEYSADALVFSASKKPVNGGNFDGRVFAGADAEKLLEARRKIGIIQSGDSAITESFGLKGYKYLIHTVMPNYRSTEYNPMERLKNCYLKSLNIAEANNIKSIVFPVLGGGCARFPSHDAKEFAIKILEEYQKTHIESCIETITLVLYDKKQEYHDFAEYNGYIRKLSEMNFPDMYFNKDSSIGRRMNKVSQQLVDKIKSETDNLYLQYLDEQREFYKKHADSDTSQDDISMQFNEELYKSIFKKNMKVKREELAGRVYVSAANDITKYQNLKTKEGIVYKNAYSFLKKRNNVIKLALGLELCLKDFCYFVWSWGHFFPIYELDYELITYYIKTEKHLEALTDYEDIFNPNYEELYKNKSEPQL